MELLGQRVATFSDWQMMQRISSTSLTRLDHPRHLNSDIQKHLIQFKGIGPWTAEMVMIFAILLPDIYSPKDIGLVNAIKRLFQFRLKQWTRLKRLQNVGLIRHTEQWHAGIFGDWLFNSIVLSRFLLNTNTVGVIFNQQLVNLES